MSLVKLNIFNKQDSLALLDLWVEKTSSNQRLSLLYDLLEDIMDVPRYEFTDFCNSLVHFFSKIDRDVALEDFQLLKRISNNFFNRIRGRNPELQEFLQCLKVDFVERAVKEQKEEALRHALIGEQEDLEQQMSDLGLEDTKIRIREKNLKIIYYDMKQYLEDCTKEHSRI